jgi:UDPglucose 6-dehydrogenase
MMAGKGTEAAMIRNILCIGAGYVGGPTMAMIAAKCPDIAVTVCDVNGDRIRAWQTDHLPIYEPGLLDLVRQSRGRNLSFSTDIDGGIEKSDLIMVCVNTPTKVSGEGAGMAADLRYCEETARRIRACARSPKIVVEKSTVPVRTAEAIERVLHAAGTVTFDVLSNPEFLAEGTAVRDMENPDRVLIGGRDTESGRRAVEELVRIYARWVPRDRILTTSTWSSELSKLAANAFLAQRVSSINALSALCEATGADVTEVSRAIGMDSRIGPKFLKAGPGFGGSCFRKDVLDLVYLCEHYGLGMEAGYWRQVIAMNERQQARISQSVVRALFGTVAGKRIAVFGFAFKADTGDTRDSPAIAVCRRLAEENARVVVTDPQALDAAARDLADLGDRVEYEPDPYKAARGAHAIILMTDWDAYRRLDCKRLHDSMEKPASIFDTRNLLDHDAFHKADFDVYSIGRPALTHG